jgi:hypothetical protein
MLICALRTGNRSAHSNVEAKGGTACNSKGKKYGENCPYASYVNIQGSKHLAPSQNSSVGIATHYGLYSSGIESP